MPGDLDVAVALPGRDSGDGRRDGLGPRQVVGHLATGVDFVIAGFVRQSQEAVLLVGIDADRQRASVRD